VPVEPAIAYFGRLRFVRVEDEREIVEKSSAEIQSGQTSAAPTHERITQSRFAANPRIVSPASHKKRNRQPSGLLKDS